MRVVSLLRTYQLMHACEFAGPGLAWFGCALMPLDVAHGGLHTHTQGHAKLPAYPPARLLTHTCPPALWCTQMGRHLKKALTGSSAQGLVSSAASSFASGTRSVTRLVSAGVAAATTTAVASSPPTAGGGASLLAGMAAGGMSAAAATKSGRAGPHGRAHAKED